MWTGCKMLMLWENGLTDLWSEYSGVQTASARKLAAVGRCLFFVGMKRMSFDGLLVCHQFHFYYEELLLYMRWRDEDPMRASWREEV